MRSNGFWTASVLALLIALVLQGQAAARVAVITTADGQRFTGEVQGETADSITILIASIPRTFEKAGLASLEFRLTAREEFAQRRAKLADEDVQGRFELALWAYTQQAHDLAKKELDDLVVRAPDNTSVANLARAVDSAIELQKSQTPASPSSPSTPAVPSAQTPGVAVPATPAANVKLPTKMLVDRDINIIRIYETPLDDKPVVNVPSDVFDTIFKEHAASDLVPKGVAEQNRLRSKTGRSGWETLNLITKLSARNLYPKLQLPNDPASFQTFKNIHRTYVLGYCATNECHGGANAGPLFLFNGRPTDNQTVYTNFYILNAYSNDKGYMIDRSKPEQSLLIQYGMPPAMASLKHPNVPGWSPRILTPNDASLRTIREWVGKELLRGGGDYPGVDYVIPNMTKTAPAPVEPAAPPAEGEAPAETAEPAPAAEPAHEDVPVLPPLPGGGGNP